MPRTLRRVYPWVIPAWRSPPFPGRSVLAIIPVVAFFYILLVLPFMGGGEGTPRIGNILFWPALAGSALVLALYNIWRLDRGFIFSPPIASLVAYLMFACASIGWAFSPDYSFSRYMAQLGIVIVCIVPYALPIPTTHTVQRLHVCCAIAVAINALYVLMTPPTPFGHPGYWNHKQELGMFCGAAIILSVHELLFRWWRRLLAVMTICATFWLIFASNSKSPLPFLFVAMAFAAVALVACKYLRTTPAFIVAAVVVGSQFVSDPIGRIAYRLYGDSTVSGRTYIWDFINYRVSQRSWFGWGFHSYWGVPNSPHNEAPGFVKDMISTHNGYLELRLDTGSLGYWIFLAFVYASLHLVEPVRRKDPIRAWVFLSLSSYVIQLNLVESIWMQTVPLWALYLIVVGESVRMARSEQASVGPALLPLQSKRGRGLSAQRPRPVEAARHAIR